MDSLVEASTMIPELDEFETAYQKTEGKHLFRCIESYTNNLNLETEWVLTWLDILLTHAHEKNGCNKIIRACNEVDKTRANTEAKRVKEQAKSRGKTSNQSEANTNNNTNKTSTSANTTSTSTRPNNKPFSEIQ